MVHKCVLFCSCCSKSLKIFERWKKSMTSSFVLIFYIFIQCPWTGRAWEADTWLARRSPVVVPAGYTKPLPPSQRDSGTSSWTAFSLLCATGKVLLKASVWLQSCSDLKNMRDLLHSVSEIKTIQVFWHQPLSHVTSCSSWVSQSHLKLLFPNKLCKTFDCFEMCRWTVLYRGFLIY